MEDLLHHPDTHRLGKRDAVAPHAMLDTFVDFEKAATVVTVPANIINSTAAADGAPMSIALAMYLNDHEGCCTYAGAGNLLRVVSNGSVQVVDDDVQGGYIRTTAKENNGQGYDPATGANDNGCVEIDVLDDLTIVGLGGHKAIGHAGVDPKNRDQMRMALYLAGALYPGWQLSTDQQSQQIWQPGSAPAGSWGGHCAPIFDWLTEIPAGFTIAGATIDPSTGEILVLGTWSQYKGALYSYVPFAMDECHVLIFQEWIDKAKGLGIVDEAALNAFLQTLQHESLVGASA